jgi:hypothetical protein
MKSYELFYQIQYTDNLMNLTNSMNLIDLTDIT